MVLRAIGFPMAPRSSRLASPLTRTPWPVFRNGQHDTAPQLTLLRCLHAMLVCSRLVSGSFNLPLRVLFSVHSRYYCAIGLETYLGLEVCDSQIHARYPTHTTQDALTLPLASVPLRDCHPLWSSIPGNIRVLWRRDVRVYTPHVPDVSIGDSVCPIPFSIAFTNGISIDFFSSPYADVSTRGVPDH